MSQIQYKVEKMMYVLLHMYFSKAYVRNSLMSEIKVWSYREIISLLVIDPVRCSAFSFSWWQLRICNGCWELGYFPLLTELSNESTLVCFSYTLILHIVASFLEIWESFKMQAFCLELLRMFFYLLLHSMIAIYCILTWLVFHCVGMFFIFYGSIC